MTYEDVAAEVRRLPMQEQLRLVEEITRSVRETLVSPEAAEHNDDEAAWREAFEAERTALLRDIPPDSPVHRTFGMLRTTKHAPTDEEIEEEYREYLTRKYA